jgi:hypothetical protein
MATPTISTPYFSQSFKGTASTSSLETVGTPVGSFWDDSRTKLVLCINVFLILENKYDLSNTKPTLRSVSPNNIELNFDFEFDPSAPDPGGEPIWYLQYHISFDASVVGDMTILTAVTEIIKPIPHTITMPRTIRGTTTTVQH